jgi:serine/threonine protein kinase
MDIFFFDAEPKVQRLCLVMPYCQTDMHQVISAVRQEVTEEHIRWWLYQTLLGLAVLHRGGVMHRDVTPTNLLLSMECDLKIADFGLARSRPGDGPELMGHPLTDYVVTRYYRAPELLLGQRDYDARIDVWSLGCIAVELYNRAVLFRGGSSLHQMALIVDIATPVRSDRPISDIPLANKFVSDRSVGEPVPLERLLSGASTPVIDLVKKMLQFDAEDRITVRDALRHEAFSDLRQPGDLEEIERVSLMSFDESGLHTLEGVHRRLELLCRRVAIDGCAPACELPSGERTPRGAKGEKTPMLDKVAEFRDRAMLASEPNNQHCQLFKSPDRPNQAHCHALARSRSSPLGSKGERELGGSVGPRSTGTFGSVEVFRPACGEMRLIQTSDHPPTHAPLFPAMPIAEQGDARRQGDCLRVPGRHRPHPGYMKYVWKRLPEEEERRGLPHSEGRVPEVTRLLQSVTCPIVETVFQAIETTSAGLLRRVVIHPKFPLFANQVEYAIMALRRSAYLCCADLVRILALAMPGIVSADTSSEYAGRELILPSGQTSSSRGPAVHTAAAKCSVGSLHVLVSLGASVNSISPKKLTPLLSAIEARAYWNAVYLLSIEDVRKEVPSAKVKARDTGVPVIQLAVERIETRRNCLASPTSNPGSKN